MLVVEAKLDGAFEELVNFRANWPQLSIKEHLQ